MWSAAHKKGECCRLPQGQVQKSAEIHASAHGSNGKTATFVIYSGERDRL